MVITVNGSLAVQVPNNNLLVTPGNNVTLQAIVSGGTAPYTVTWTGPNGFTVSYVLPSAGATSVVVPNVTASSSGIYKITVTDPDGSIVSAVINVLVRTGLSSLTQAIVEKYCPIIT